MGPRRDAPTARKSRGGSWSNPSPSPETPRAEDAALPRWRAESPEPNTQFSASLTGQTLPAANANAQVTAAISTLVIVETTAQLRIAGAKQISVAY